MLRNAFIGITVMFFVFVKINQMYYLLSAAEILFDDKYYIVRKNLNTPIP